MIVNVEFFIIESDCKKYFYISVACWTRVYDYYICELLNMDLKCFYKIMTNDFNGKIFLNELYFINKEDIQDAIEWLNCYVILNKLKG